MYTMEGKRMPCLHFPDQITRWLPLGLLVIRACVTTKQDFDGQTSLTSSSLFYSNTITYIQRHAFSYNLLFSMRLNKTSLSGYGSTV